MVATPSTVSTGQTGGVNDSSVVATVTSAGSPVVGDTVAVTATPSTAGSCGTIPATGVTIAGGTVTLAYVGTAVVGTCTIKVTEADNGLSGSTVITQAANNTVSITATPGSATAPHTVVESGGGVLTPNALTATVTTPAAAPVVGETINFTLTPETPLGCGTLTAASEVTAAGGVATDNYNSPFVTGLCLITATEATAQTGESAPQSGTTYYNSTSAAVPAATTVTFTAAAASVPENTPATVTVTVGAAVIASDPVFLTVTPTTAATCGTLNATAGVTNASSVATFTYTASGAAGTCTITAVESHNNITSAVPEVITQTANNSVVVTASPSSVVDSGSATSTVTATVTSSTGSAVTGDVVTFTTAASPAGSCGTFTPASAGATNSSGVVTVTYTSSTTAGFCTVTATESGTAQAGTTVIDQT